MNFFYDDCVPEDLTVDSAEKLLALADKYDVPRLKYLCESVILPKVTPENSLYYVCVGDMHNSADMKAKAIHVILKHFKEIAKTDKWSEFAREKPVLLADIMSSLGSGYSFSVKLI